MTLFVGLLSGTSADAIDAALVDFSGDEPRLCFSLAQPFEPQLRRDILSLYTPDLNEIDRLGVIDNRLGEAFASTTLALLDGAGINPNQVVAIGCHGQTIRHRPHLSRSDRFTLQIGNPNVIAQRTGITVISDFRRRDMACGGEGAPLAPGFHRAVFQGTRPRAVLNFGGIANLTVLATSGQATGFDVGPANALMDAWIARTVGRSFDENGDWAASGKVIAPLLQSMLQHPYFAASPPKSTGREEFTLEWLLQELETHKHAAPADVQATLLQLSVETIVDAISRYCQPGTELFICGGGAHNSALMQRLSQALPGSKVDSTEALGVHPDWVEAMLFAWLAKQTWQNLPGNLPAVTGAQREVVLGAIYPGASFGAQGLR